MIEIVIDPNVRMEGGLTFSGFEDVRGDPFSLIAGLEVVVVEPESGVAGFGFVDHVSSQNELVFLSVNWGALRLAN